MMRCGDKKTNLVLNSAFRMPVSYGSARKDDILILTHQQPMQSQNHLLVHTDQSEIQPK